MTDDDADVGSVTEINLDRCIEVQSDWLR
jgi:hypothetical protein